MSPGKESCIITFYTRAHTHTHRSQTQKSRLRQADKIELLRWNDLPVEREDVVLSGAILHSGMTPSPKKVIKQQRCSQLASIAHFYHRIAAQHTTHFSFNIQE